MNGKAESDGRGMGKNRIEALTDGIFAVAMTLLVLDIKPPVHLRFETSDALIDHLSVLEHSFVMYAISFVVLAMFWLGHHLQFHFVRHVDRQLLWINLLFLLIAVVVPFSTNLVGDHGHLQLPVVLYAVNLLVLTAAAVPAVAPPGRETPSDSSGSDRRSSHPPPSAAPPLRCRAGGFDRGVVLQPATGHVPLRAARRACLPSRQDRPVDARRRPAATTPPRERATWRCRRAAIATRRRRLPVGLIAATRHNAQSVTAGAWWSRIRCP